MKSAQQAHDHIDLIPVEEILVLNPRSRNKRIHGELVENIRAIGLKRPITVSLRSKSSGNLRYNLVCGQGRLEAFKLLGQSAIPAIVIRATQEDCLVMSLVENVARRHYQPIDMMREIGRLRERGNSDQVIAKLIGVTPSWVNMVGNLLDKGEEKLLAAVEMGIIPLSMATDIARASDTDIQSILADAYEQGMRGKRLSVMRRLLDRRSKKGQLVRGNEPSSSAPRKKLTALELRKLLEHEAERQRIAVKKAAFAHDRLVFAVQALKELHSTPAFVKILEREELMGVPKLLASRMQSGVSL